MDKTTLRIIGAALTLVLFVFPSSAQVKIQVGAGGGVLLPMGDYAGETTEYYAGTNYGLSTGYGFGAKGRFGFGGFTLVGGINYGHFSNTGAGDATRGEVEVKQDIVTVKVGPEFTIPIPGSPLSPYIGANLAWNSISGKTKFQGLTSVPSSEFDVEAASRFGFGINAGVVFSLGMGMMLDIGAEYAFINPLSKEWTVVDPTNPRRVDSYMALNDEKDPAFAAGNTDHFVGASRSISTLGINATFMFGF